MGLSTSSVVRNKTISHMVLGWYSQKISFFGGENPSQSFEARSPVPRSGCRPTQCANGSLGFGSLGWLKKWWLIVIDGCSADFQQFHWQPWPVDWWLIVIDGVSVSLWLSLVTDLPFWFQQCFPMTLDAKISVRMLIRNRVTNGTGLGSTAGWLCVCIWYEYVYIFIYIYILLYKYVYIYIYMIYVWFTNRKLFFQITDTPIEAVAGLSFLATSRSAAEVLLNPEAPSWDKSCEAAVGDFFLIVWIGLLLFIGMFMDVYWSLGWGSYIESPQHFWNLRMDPQRGVLQQWSDGLMGSHHSRPAILWCFAWGANSPECPTTSWRCLSSVSLHFWNSSVVQKCQHCNGHHSGCGQVALVESLHAMKRW